MNGGERVAQALRAHGVREVFTLCGGHISPILVAAKAAGLRIVDMRGEAAAVFAADAVGRLTGTPGVAAVTAGPGVTNAVTALQNARLAQSSLLLIGGAAPTALQGRGALQDIDQSRLLGSIVKRRWRVRAVADLGPAVEEALACSRSGVPGPVFVECAVDLLYDEATIRRWYAEAAGKGTAIGDRLLRAWLERHANGLFRGASAPYAPAVREAPVPEPRERDVARAARALARAERPLAVIGSQALFHVDGAAGLAQAVARLGIPAYLSGMARGLLGRDHPLQMRHARREALREADCVVLAGVPCDFRLDYGRHVRRSATLVAANRSTAEARLNRRPAIAAIGDAGRFLASLARAANATADRGAWIARLRERDQAREASIDAGIGTGPHVDPIAFLRALDRVAGEAAIFVADGGDFVATASYILRPRGPLAWLDPGVFGTLGVGAGFAAGAAVARPGAEIWLLWGDGASGYGLAELDSFVRHGLPVIAVVGNDASWAQIAREQVKLLGDDVSTVLRRTAYHEVARGLGAEGVEIRDLSEVDSRLALARSLARSGRPVLVNVWLDRTGFREGSISM